MSATLLLRNLHKYINKYTNYEIKPQIKLHQHLTLVEWLLW